MVGATSGRGKVVLMAIQHVAIKIPKYVDLKVVGLRIRKEEGRGRGRNV